MVVPSQGMPLMRVMGVVCDCLSMLTETDTNNKSRWKEGWWLALRRVGTDEDHLLFCCKG